MEKYFNKSARLRNEADIFLKSEKVHDLLTSEGKVVYVGSYQMNLMLWEDIDINIIPEHGDKDKTLKNLVSKFLLRNDLKRLSVYFDLRERYGKSMPDSLYLGIRIGKWKLDISIMDEKEAEDAIHTVNWVTSLLTDEKKKSILYWKDHFLTPSGRTLKLSSYYIYEAILKYNMNEKNDIYNYLKKNDINLLEG